MTKETKQFYLAVLLFTLICGGGGIILYSFTTTIPTKYVTMSIVAVVLGIYIVYILGSMDETDNPYNKKKILYTIIGVTLLLIGTYSVLTSSSIDNNNSINISYLRNQVIESTGVIHRPILSTSPEPPPQPLDFLQKTLAAIGSIIFLPAVIIDFLKEQISAAIEWVIRGTIALIILCASLVGIPLGLQNRDSSPTPIPSQTPDPPLTLPNEEVYYASVDISAPPYIKQGQSQILELNFNLMNTSSEETIPIILPKASTYVAAISTQLVNFELSSPPAETQESRDVNINETVTWQWVVTPKAEAEGKQSIIWNIELKDSEGTKIKDLPTVVIEIDIKPKLGVPSWILGSNFTLAALVSGIFLNWAAIRTMKQSKQYEKRQDEKEELKKERQATFNQLLNNFKKTFNTEEAKFNTEEAKTELSLLIQFVNDNKDLSELLEQAPKEDKDWFLSLNWAALKNDKK